MARGRRPLPDSVKKLRGNPGKRKLRTDVAAPMKGEAVPPAATAKDVAALPVPPPPKHFGKIAADEWRRVAPIMVELGTLREADRSVFEARCLAYERLIQARRESKGKLTYTAPNGTIRPHPLVKVMEQAERAIRQFDVEYGLTPASRARVAHVTGNEFRRRQEELPLDDKSAAAPKPPTESKTEGVPGGGAAPQPLSDDAFFAGPPVTRH